MVLKFDGMLDPAPIRSLFALLSPHLNVNQEVWTLNRAEFWREVLA